ncbi:MAG TPA: ECF-type sigma factor [Phycisphaerales bacterium]|nr:ECF-type sigma factor [Phycisphaerales bacterium]
MDPLPPAKSPPSLPDDESHAGQLMPLVYDELRRIATSLLSRKAGMTIQPTALVHEAYLKLSREHASQWNDESHFRAVASVAMRRVLADHVRSKNRIKRGGEVERLEMTLDQHPDGEQPRDVELVHEALEELEAVAPRVARLVVYRFFGNLDVKQAADRLGVSLSTAEADWRFARAWLKHRLGHDSKQEGSA